MKRVAFLLLLPLFCHCYAAEGEQAVISRIYAHTLVGDHVGAIEEAKGAIATVGYSSSLWEAYIGALARGEERVAMLQAWKHYSEVESAPYKNRQLLEKMAWSEIAAAYRSSSPAIRMTALIAASFGDDVRGVELLCQGLSDNNTFIRAATLQLSSKLRDPKLCSAVVNLFRRERIAHVRFEAVKALGKMKVHGMKREILALLMDEKTEAVGKAAAIEAMVALEENVSHSGLTALANSPRSGLRQLACEVISCFDLVDDLELIVPLLRDPQPCVRIAALRAIGILRPKTTATLIAPLIHDRDREVAITAAWVATIDNPKKGQQLLQPWLSHERGEVRLMAAGALVATGKHGYPLTLEAFDKSSDPYVQLTLAWGMISQRKNVDAACYVIRKWLLSNHERWMWDEKLGFRTLAPSKVKHNAAIAHFPEAVSQMVRLELLNALAIVGDDFAEQAIKAFLSERGWGISSAASALLLTEGDETAITLVEELLDAENRTISTQAALILALWGRGEASIQKLEAAYEGASRELKERILEGVGRVGLANSLPFLVDKLSEPYPTLRIIAAAALLQCLNN